MYNSYNIYYSMTYNSTVYYSIMYNSYNIYYSITYNSTVYYSIMHYVNIYNHHNFIGLLKSLYLLINNGYK